MSKTAKILTWWAKKSAICLTPTNKRIEMLLKCQMSKAFSALTLRFFPMTLILTFFYGTDFLLCGNAARWGGESSRIPVPPPRKANGTSKQVINFFLQAAVDLLSLDFFQLPNQLLWLYYFAYHFLLNAVYVELPTSCT